MRRYNDTAPVRLLRNAERTSEGCLLFGQGIGSDGYGRLNTGGRQGTLVTAHTAAWELVNGPVPEGMILDHLCHSPEKCAGGVTCLHRRCIELSHLGLTTRKHNSSAERSSRWSGVRRFCKNGHEKTEDNIYHMSNGYTACRACRRMWAAQQNEKRRQRKLT